MSELVDLMTLRAIVAVADCGSISAGSDQVHLALAAVSSRISALETEWGMPIFKRTSRGVLLTPAGHMLVQRARELLTDADRLRSDLVDYRTGIQGHVRLLANASSMLEVVPQRLERFVQAHPLIRVEVEERTSPEIPLAVLDGRADVGILDISHPLQGLQFQDLFINTLALIVPRDHPAAALEAIALQEVLAENFIGLTDGNAISNRLLAAATMVGRPLNIRMQMRSFDAVCRMVAARVGVSVLPVQAIGPQLSHLPIAAVPLSDGWATRTHRLIIREDVEARPAVRLLMQALVAVPGTR